MLAVEKCCLFYYYYPKENWWIKKMSSPSTQHTNALRESERESNVLATHEVALGGHCTYIILQ